MNTNLQYGYDKLLTKDEFYLDVIYPNLVKSAGIFYYKEEYARARRNGNAIEDVINQAFFYAYKPLVRGGKYGKAGGTIYDYYVENYFHVKNGDTELVIDYLKDDKGHYVYEEVDGKKQKVQIGEHEELIKPRLNTIRAYMNTFVRNVIVDMCKVAENKKNLVSLDTPIGDEENGKTLMDVISDIEDYDVSDSLKDLHSSVKGEFINNKNGIPISVDDILLSLESGSSIKETSNHFGLTDFDILNFFKDNFDLMKDCFETLSDSSMKRLSQRINRAKKEVDVSAVSTSLDDLREFMIG